MFKNVLEKIGVAGKNKSENASAEPLRYLVSSMLAGAYVGIGILLIFTIGGQLSAAESAFTKIVMGISFGIALSLVVMAGAELFTGNNLIMTIAGLEKSVKPVGIANVWVLSFIGNFIGSIIIGWLFVQTGLVDKGAVLDFFVKVSEAKTTNSISHLFFAGILCNVLVCLAVWCSFKLESETAKLIMIWWCLFAFITSGYEHSVANMTIFAVSFFVGKLSIGALLYNLLWVTLGNMVGGIALGGIYYYVSQTKKAKK